MNWLAQFDPYAGSIPPSQGANSSSHQPPRIHGKANNRAHRSNSPSRPPSATTSTAFHSGGGGLRGPTQSHFASPTPAEAHWTPASPTSPTNAPLGRPASARSSPNAHFGASAASGSVTQGSKHHHMKFRPPPFPSRAPAPSRSTPSIRPKPTDSRSFGAGPNAIHHLGSQMNGPGRSSNLARPQIHMKWPASHGSNNQTLKAVRATIHEAAGPSQQNHDASRTRKPANDGDIPGRPNTITHASSRPPPPPPKPRVPTLAPRAPAKRAEDYVPGESKTFIPLRSENSPMAPAIRLDTGRTVAGSTHQSMWKAFQRSGGAKESASLPPHSSNLAQPPIIAAAASNRGKKHNGRAPPLLPDAPLGKGSLNDPLDASRNASVSSSMRAPRVDSTSLPQVHSTSLGPDSTLAERIPLTASRDVRPHSPAFSDSAEDKMSPHGSEVSDRDLVSSEAYADSETSVAKISNAARLSRTPSDDRPEQQLAEDEMSAHGSEDSEMEIVGSKASEDSDENKIAKTSNAARLSRTPSDDHPEQQSAEDEMSAHGSEDLEMEIVGSKASEDSEIRFATTSNGAHPSRTPPDVHSEQQSLGQEVEAQGGRRFEQKAAATAKGPLIGGSPSPGARGSHPKVAAARRAGDPSTTIKTKPASPNVHARQEDAHDRRHEDISHPRKRLCRSSSREPPPLLPEESMAVEQEIDIVVSTSREHLPPPESSLAVAGGCDELAVERMSAAMRGDDGATLNHNAASVEAPSSDDEPLAAGLARNHGRIPSLNAMQLSSRSSCRLPMRQMFMIPLDSRMQAAHALRSRHAYDTLAFVSRLGSMVMSTPQHALGPLSNLNGETSTSSPSRRKISDVKRLAPSIMGFTSSDATALGPLPGQVGLSYAMPNGEGRPRAHSEWLKPTPHMSGATSLAPIRIYGSTEVSFATGGSDGTIHRWRWHGLSTNTADVERMHSMHEGPVVSLTNLPRHHLMVSQGGAHSDQLIGYRYDHPAVSFQWTSKDPVAHLTHALHADLFIATVRRSDHEQLKLYDVRCDTGGSPRTISKPVIVAGWQATRTPAYLGRPAFHAKQRNLVAQGTEEGHVRVFDLRKTGQPLFEERISQSPVYDVVWSPPGEPALSLYAIDTGTSKPLCHRLELMTS
ncbi:WD40/YVTN repeat-like-containing domain [Ceraceosorus bombacis]|uniref:WD40/YVTN repeat-like-containing domain n=1 Tax=Ceraceosorus bombacis TaxID=401625 RepID=A0A0P1BJH7_9BASI|nr:WD40/YVTN repeat-like-containing domain [Ceraceosorus bombacis]